MKDIISKYEIASKQYVDQAKLEIDVIGIIISGSLKYSKIDKNSDVDVYVILDETCDYRERGNTWINGVEIEYFKNPPQQIRAYFKKELKSPHTAHMIAFGELVFCKSDEVIILIKEAKSIMNELPTKMSHVEMELENISLTINLRIWKIPLIIKIKSAQN